MAYATIIRGTSRLNYTVEANDGSSFYIPIPLCKRLSVHKGDELSETEFVDLHRKVSLLLIRAKALDLLGRREHGEYELMIKLIQKGFEKEYIQQILTQLKEENLLNDYRYASSLILSRQRSNPEGISLLRYRLRSKRVDSQAIEKALDEWLHYDDNYYVAVRKAVERYMRRHGDSEKIVEAMQKKGCPRRDVLEVLEDLRQ